LGIAGVDGSGQLELMEALAGLRPVAKGEILMEHCDRIATLFKGTIVAEFARSEFSREAIGAAMVGATQT